MNLQRNSLFSVFDKVLPWIFLGIMLFYTYAKFWGHPYGIRWSSSGNIIFVFKDQRDPTFRAGDHIIKIGDVSWEEFNHNLSQRFFDGAQPGQVIPSTVERDGEIVNINWVYPGTPSGAEFLDQFVSEWFFAYFFWLAGVLTVLFVRPKDESWLLMALFNFLTAVWLIAGSGVSAYHIGYAAIVLRVVIWLCLPIYLHLHWVFPRPLGKLSPWLIATVYGLSVLLALAQAFQLLPVNLYLLAFLVAVSGSLILLLIHLWRQPAIRRDFRLLSLALILAVAPAVIWTVLISTVGTPAYYGSIGLLSLPLLPLAYLYAAFRRRLGQHELRVNRFLTIYTFVILLGAIGLSLLAFADYSLQVENKSMIIGSAAALATMITCLWGYPAFENFMNRHILGIPLTSKRLLESFSTQITTSVSLGELIRVLQEEILPSLLIRQFAFLQYDPGSLSILYATGWRDDLLPGEKDVPYLTEQSGSYRSPAIVTPDQFYPWIRLILPLKLGDQLLGFWLLGRRDPDDLYSQQEIPTLSSLANLAAIALSNILQTERLRSMYEFNINRYEQERLRLARDLHDSILNEMAALPLRSDAPVFSASFREAYEDVSEQLRGITHELRPPMLAFGLNLALDAFAETLKERSQDAVEVTTDVQTDGECRYPVFVENNVYRIVQEACENSLRYAQAKKLILFAKLHPGELEIKVEDDGVGLNPEIRLRLNDLLAGRHFGLAGMHERASLIGAKLSIHASPGEGTQIHIHWKSNES